MYGWVDGWEREKRDLNYFSNIMHATGDLIILKLKSEPSKADVVGYPGDVALLADWTAGQIDQGSPSVMGADGALH